MAPTSFRILKTLALSAVASLAVVACGGGGGGGNGNLASDQTLNFPILGDFGTLDPATADAETDQEIQQNFQDGLVRFDANLNIVPDLATAVPSASSDGLTYTFNLRKDVTFSNGDTFTSKDVLFSWNRAAAYQGAYATNLSAIQGYDTVAKNKKAGKDLEALLEANDPSVTMGGLTAPDPYTVQVKLSQPAGWFMTAIAKYEQGGYDIVGYGGYSNLPVADILRIKNTSNESAQLLLHPKVRSYWVSFNMVHDASRQAGGPFLLSGGDKAKNLRLAFALAVDKNALVQTVCQGIVCTPATGGLIPPTLIGHMDSVDPLSKFDDAQAKTLLQQNGGASAVA